MNRFHDSVGTNDNYNALSRRLDSSDIWLEQRLKSQQQKTSPADARNKNECIPLTDTADVREETLSLIVTGDHEGRRQVDSEIRNSEEQWSEIPSTCSDTVTKQASYIQKQGFVNSRRRKEVKHEGKATIDGCSSLDRDSLYFVCDDESLDSAQADDNEQTIPYTNYLRGVTLSSGDISFESREKSEKNGNKEAARISTDPETQNGKAEHYESEDQKSNNDGSTLRGSMLSIPWRGGQRMKRFYKGLVRRAGASKVAQVDGSNYSLGGGQVPPVPVHGADKNRPIFNGERTTFHKQMGHHGYSQERVYDLHLKRAIATQEKNGPVDSEQDIMSATSTLPWANISMLSKRKRVITYPSDGGIELISCPTMKSVEEGLKKDNDDARSTSSMNTLAGIDAPSESASLSVSPLGNWMESILRTGPEICQHCKQPFHFMDVQTYKHTASPQCKVKGIFHQACFAARKRARKEMSKSLWYIRLAGHRKKREDKGTCQEVSCTGDQRKQPSYSGGNPTQKNPGIGDIITDLATNIGVVSTKIDAKDPTMPGQECQERCSSRSSDSKDKTNGFHTSSSSSVANAPNRKAKTGKIPAAKVVHFLEHDEAPQKRTLETAENPNPVDPDSTRVPLESNPPLQLIKKRVRCDQHISRKGTQPVLRSKEATSNAALKPSGQRCTIGKSHRSKRIINTNKDRATSMNGNVALASNQRGRSRSPSAKKKNMMPLSFHKISASNWHGRSRSPFIKKKDPVPTDCQKPNETNRQGRTRSPSAKKKSIIPFNLHKISASDWQERGRASFAKKKDTVPLDCQKPNETNRRGRTRFPSAKKKNTMPFNFHKTSASNWQSSFTKKKHSIPRNCQKSNEANRRGRSRSPAPNDKQRFPFNSQETSDIRHQRSTFKSCAFSPQESNVRKPTLPMDLNPARRCRLARTSICMKELLDPSKSRRSAE